MKKKKIQSDKEIFQNTKDMLSQSKEVCNLKNFKERCVSEHISWKQSRCVKLDKLDSSKNFTCGKQKKNLQKLVK